MYNLYIQVCVQVKFKLVLKNNFELEFHHKISILSKSRLVQGLGESSLHDICIILMLLLFFKLSILVICIEVVQVSQKMQQLLLHMSVPEELQLLHAPCTSMHSTACPLHATYTARNCTLRALAVHVTARPGRSVSNPLR